MRHATAVLVRLAVLAVALAIYIAWVAASADPDGAGGADIGAGLIAFAGIIVVSGVWALVDGRRQDAQTALVWWTVVAVLLAIGWWVAGAAVQRDGSMSFADMLAADSGQVPFTAGLVLVPAAVGALIGQAARRR
jgi:hypothetical protein